uniref:Uncharacterized protein LOC105852787 n=1 Tax=Cicer arietinum TaxID=3827 RepID=A0A1S3EGH6_CICAR|nr:uncharacterized protein LOC105852787 [Cicer arietinum]
MARTKTMAYKNPRSSPPSCLSSSPSPSLSPVRSPSPPPRPTPPHSSFEKTFSDYLSSSPEPCPQPLSTKLPPLYQCPTPSFSQCPPHLRNTMNPSSSSSSSQRRSMLIQAGIGTSKPIYTISDDSEPLPPQNNPKSQTTHESHPPKPKSPQISKSQEIPKTNSPSPKSSTKNLPTKIKHTKSQPRKPKSKSPSTLSQFLASQKLKIPKKSQKTTPQERSSPPLQPQERSSIPPERSSLPLQERSSSQLSPQERSSTKQPTKKRSPLKTPTQKPKKTSTKSNPKPFTKSFSSKILIPPLISSKIQKLFSEKWAQRPIGIGRVFDFEKHQIEGISIQHHTNALGWIDFLKIIDCHYQQVIRTFYCKAEAFEDKSLIVSTLKGIEIQLDPLILADILKLPSEGLTIYGKDWYTALNISKEEVFQELFVDGSTKCLSANPKPLPKLFNNISQHMITVAVTNSSLIMMHFEIPLSTESSIIKISKFSSKNLSHMKQIPTIPPLTTTCFQSIIHKQKKTICPNLCFPHNNFSPFVPHHFAPNSIPQINTTFATLSTFCTSATPSNSTPMEDHQHHSKRTKLEKESSRAYKNIPRIFAALQTIVARQAHQDKEQAILQDWIANQLAPKLGLEPPMPNPLPTFPDIPQPFCLHPLKGIPRHCLFKSLLEFYSPVPFCYDKGGEIS